MRNRQTTAFALLKKRTGKMMIKRIGAGLLGICLLCQPLTAYGAEWERGADGLYQLADGTPIQGVVSRGIDVSYWKMDIDWEQVAADDVTFAMLGTRFRGAVDPYFAVNAEKARQAGLEIGAYIYSYATSVEMAEQEAEFVLNLIKDYPISYPVAFDAEDNDTLGTLSPSEVSQVINAFCRKIEEAGYYPMVYANEYWLTNKINLSLLDYDIWVARYNTMYTFDNPSMWQATNTGSVNGVNGNVDIDFSFKDYSSIIPSDTWRTIGGNRYYYEDDIMQKSTWIDDGQGWYYMNENGNPSTGWLTMPEGKYYLDPFTGEMSVGWRSLEGGWYYFKPAGMMATGWRQINGSWYYLNEEGVMQTGWQEIGGKRYFLEDSGVMAAGWRDLNGARYYFQPDGQMSTGWVQTDGHWYYLNGDGQMQTGWQEIGGSWYYLNEDGQMQTGWLAQNGNWYYLTESGAMATGWQEINGARYYLGGNGIMSTGWLTQNGTWYYLDENGAMATGWRQVGGVWYYLNENGVMQTGWLNLNGIWYYLTESGAMATGWQEIGGALYYLDPVSGQMAANTVLEYNGTAYQADGTGACTPVSQNTQGQESSAQPQAGLTAPAGEGAAAAAPSAPANQTQGPVLAGPGASL